MLASRNVTATARRKVTAVIIQGDMPWARKRVLFATARNKCEPLAPQFFAKSLNSLSRVALSVR
jgi:hypothetical protein